MKILAISVHPDDETLGCGGTLLKHQSKGDEVFWLNLTEVTQELGYSDEYIKSREKQIKIVISEYQFREYFDLKLPTTKIHTIDFGELMLKISAVIQKIQPEIVYIVNRSDIHTDHAISSRAIISATKSFRNPFIKRILMYEVVSETEIAPPLPENLFVPNVYSDISDFLERKIAIMKIYKSEVLAPPLPRSIENIRALATYRGATVSVRYAEAFMLIKDLF